MPTLVALAGGALIGLSATLFRLAHGRIAGVSGLLADLFAKHATDRASTVAFLGGLVSVGAAAAWRSTSASAQGGSMAITVLAGLFVGIGTHLSGGCTSGHGVCGISRFSKRSIVATCTFMLTGALTVLAMRLAGRS